MTKIRHILLSASIFTSCGITAASCQAPRPTPVANTSTFAQAPNAEQTKQSADSWKSIRLKNKTGDTLTASFPKDPKSFEGATFKTQQNEPFNADISIAATDEQTVIVALIDKLPARTGVMSETERRDLFSGCWKGVASFAKQAIEERDGTSLEIDSTGSTNMLVHGRRWLVEDFTLGPYPGQARIFVEGSTAFLLVAIFPANKAVAIINSYFETVEIELNRK